MKREREREKLVSVDEKLLKIFFEAKIVVFSFFLLLMKFLFYTLEDILKRKKRKREREKKRS